MAQLKDTTITGGLSVSGTTNLTSGGQSNADITLYAASGDSPALIFQRGTTSDTLNDYKIYDTGGYLKIKQSGNSGTTGYTQVAELTNAGKLTVSTPPATDTTPTVSAWISPTDSAVKVATDATIASGDKLVIRDTSDSNIAKSSSITFGSDTSTYLRNDGTWGTPSGGGGSGDLETSVQKFVNNTGLRTLSATTGYDTSIYSSFAPYSYASTGYYSTTISVPMDDLATSTNYAVNKYQLLDVVCTETSSRSIGGSTVRGVTRVYFDWHATEFSYNSTTGTYDCTLYIFVDSSMSGSKSTVYFYPIIRAGRYTGM